jgi:hypothetical protein
MEFLEVAIERTLEKAFGLTPRQAQFVIAYGGLVLLVYASTVLTRKLRAFAQRLSATVLARWEECKRVCAGLSRFHVAAFIALAVALLLLFN